jgi:hypothetical protein
VGAAFCERCGRGFGARICSSGHRNSCSARWCGVCGKPEGELSESTPYVPLAPVSRIMGWTLVLLALRCVLHHPAGILAVAAGMVGWTLSHLLGLDPCALLTGAERTGAWLLILYGLTFVLPGPVGASARRALSWLCTRGARVILLLVRAVARGVYRAVEGNAEPDRTRRNH